MMKTIIRNVKLKNSKNGEVFLDYGKISDPSVFRFSLLRSIIQNAATDVTLMIDTNLRIGDKPSVIDETELKKLNLRYTVISVEANRQQFFGVRLYMPAPKPRKEQRIIVDLAGSEFPEEWLKAMAHYDIMLGLGRKMSFEELCLVYPVSAEGMLFDPRYFAESLVDSVVCSRVRSTFQLEKYLEAVSNEVAL